MLLHIPTDIRAKMSDRLQQVRKELQQAEAGMKQENVTLHRVRIHFRGYRDDGLVRLYTYNLEGESYANH